MKNITLLFTFLSYFALLSCDDDDDNTLSPVDFPMLSSEGKFYKLTSLKLTEPFDANKDGIYSFDLIDEIDEICAYALYFDNDKSNNPAGTGIGLRVTDNGNGNIEQDYSCGALDGLPTFWRQIDNKIYFYFFGETWESATYIAELSSDNRTLSFEMPADRGAVWPHQILMEDGTIIQYQNNFKLIYTLIE